jgi:hypothetical protein
VVACFVAVATTKKKTAPKASSKRAKKKRPAAKAPAAKSAAKTPAAKRYSPRADLGKPVDGFFAKVKEPLRAIAAELRSMIERAAPDARASIKWGMPFYNIGDGMMCAIAAHKGHVNLILSGPPGAFTDPGGLLSGEGKTGRHLKLTTLAELPRAAVRRWLETAAELARGGGSRRDGSA